MLPCAVILQIVQTVARRIAKVIERFRAVKRLEFVERTVLNFRRQLAAAKTVPAKLGFSIGEGNDYRVRLHKQDWLTQLRFQNLLCNL